MKVSVCMATFNGEKFIDAQLRSILFQLSMIDEVIISDDNSVDSTLEIVARINDARIKVYKNVYKNNLINNFENTLLHATGDVILLADQDDVWLNDKVAKFKKELEHYDLVMSDCVVVNEALQEIHKSRFEVDKCKTGILNNIIKNNYMGCCMGFTRPVLQMALPFPPAIPMHDMWIGIVAECYFKVKFIPEPLLFYRRHSANSSVTLGKNPFNIIQKLKFRYDLIKSLAWLVFKKAKINSVSKEAKVYRKPATKK